MPRWRHGTGPSRPSRPSGPRRTPAGRPRIPRPGRTPRNERAAGGPRGGRRRQVVAGCPRPCPPEPGRQGQATRTMSKPYDATVKDLAGLDPARFLAGIDAPTPLPVRLLNVDLSTVTAATDVVF